MIPAKRVFPMAKRKKGLDLVQQQQQEDQPKPTRKNRVSSLLKRFVSRSGDSHPENDAYHPHHHYHHHPHTAMSRKQRKKHLLQKLKRESSLHSFSSIPHHHPLPEILRVTPMGTSCEVTLLSSVEDGPGLYQITVTQNDGKSVVDHSYHTILNPHRTSKRHLFDDDEDYDYDYEYDYNEYDVGSNESTHDVTTDASSPERSFAVDAEETIYFVGTEDDECTRDRQRQDVHPPVGYKSLFDDSEDEDGKEEEDDDEYYDCEEEDLDEHRSNDRRRRRRDGYDYWENYYQSWRQNAVIDHESYHYNVLTTEPPKTDSTLQQQHQKQLLNTTLETIPLQYEEDEEENLEDQTVSTRDTDLPLEITVRLKPRKNT